VITNTVTNVNYFSHTHTMVVKIKNRQTDYVLRSLLMIMKVYT